MPSVGSNQAASPRLSLYLRPLRSPETLLVAALLLAAAVRFAAFFSTLADPYLAFRQGDEIFYHQWALEILGGSWGRQTAFHTTPLYAYFLALAYLAGGQSVAYVRFLNVLMGVGAVCLVALTARRILRPYPAVLATVLCALCSPPVFYEWLPDKTALTFLLTALSFSLAARATAGGAPARWAVCGLVTGLAALAHTSLLALIPSVWLHVAAGRGSRSALVKSLAFFTLGCLLGILPATAHNYLRSGDFVPISYNLGTTFYLGNHAGNVYGSYASPSFAQSHEASEEYDFNREAERRAGRSLKPSEISRYWVKQGLAEITENPLLSLRRYWRRLRWTLGEEEATDTRTYAFYAHQYRVLRPPFWGFGAVSLLGAIGALAAWRDRRCRVLLSFVVFFALALSSVLVYGRYRLPLLVPLALLAAQAPDAIVGLWRRGTAAVLALALAAGATAWFVFGTVLPGRPIGYFTDYNNQGNRYLDISRFDLAVAEYEKALTVRPGYADGVPRLFEWLIRQYTARGQTRQAEDLLVRVLAQYADDPVARRWFEENYRSLRGTLPRP